MRKLILIILAVSFYPFGCEGQINGNLPTDCDTVYVDDPEATETISLLTADVERLNGIVVTKDSEIQGLTEVVTSLESTVADKNATIDAKNTELAASAATITALNASIADKDNTISTLNTEITSKNNEINNLNALAVDLGNTIEQRDATITRLEGELADALASTPDSVIVEVIPPNSVDILTVTSCYEPGSNSRIFVYTKEEGVYPARIHFPTEELGFIGVIFTEQAPLTADMKENQTTFRIERTVDHKTGEVMYVYLPN